MRNYRIQFNNGVYRVQSSTFTSWYDPLLLWLTRVNGWSNMGSFTSYEAAHARLKHLKEDDEYNAKPWVTVLDENGTHFTEVL